MQEKPSSSEKIVNLDNQANKLGMGGKLSPDSDESSYKKRMQQRKDIQAERLQTVSYTHLTLPTSPKV